MGEEWGDAFRDLHLGMMSTFVNFKIVHFVLVVVHEPYLAKIILGC